MEPYEKIAKILRTDKDYVRISCERLQEITGHDDVLSRIVEENERAMRECLALLSITTNAEDIFRGLIHKVRRDDAALFEHFRRPTCETEEGCKTLLGFARELADVGKGYFLKTSIAREFLEREPPRRILSFFGYANVSELLQRHALFEVYSALRFIEDPEWLNNVFFRQLESVVPDDFEEREIEVHVLPQVWLGAAEKFLKKKYHNVSHLKELGIIFVIPLKIDMPGETLRVFSLILHYLHEVAFYSKLFRRYAASDRDTFSRKLISSLRGDVRDTRFADQDRGKKWMIVQRYLAKDDPYDWRLFEPHVNPEAIHWTKAEDDVARLSKRFPNLAGLSFWRGLDWVGNHFQDASGVEVLVSFNLIDTVMSLVQQREMIKYLYHHKEALWNKIFMDYLGRERMEELIVEQFDQGYIDLNNVRLRGE